MNAIWGFMVLAALVCGSITGKLGDVSKASVDAAETAVKLAIGLVGVMALWIGLMKVLEEAGFLNSLARMLKPLMRKLFPSVPPEHPAMSMMILNTSANILGLNNAATPFGLKAMSALDELNPNKGTASNAMALFLAINTAGVAVFPTTMIAARATLGSASPGSIILPTLIASIIGTAVAIAAALGLQRLPGFRLKSQPSAAAYGPARTRASSGTRNPGGWSRAATLVLTAGVLISFGYALWQQSQAAGWKPLLKTVFADWSLALLIATITLVGIYKRVKIYDVVVEGGKESFDIVLKIIPFLVAMLVAVGMLRASGAIDFMVRALQPLTALIGMPPEVLPMAVLRSLTGGGSMGLATDLMKTHGPDSLIGTMASTIFGSSETTFYVIAVYFGSVQIRNGRHTLAACLLADAAAVLSSVWVCRWMLT